MNLVHSNWNGSPFQSTPYHYSQEDILENYETPALERYVDSMEKFFQVTTKDEIRKGCRWKISFLFSKTLMKTCPIKRVHVLRKESDLLSIPSSKRDEYFLVLKVRSKLITPKKEVELEKACTILSESLSLRVREDSAHIEVKFTQRPRSLFHKHSDVMILVGTLYYGQKELFQDTQELVFRGGTGSAHSAAAEKKKRTVQTSPIEQVQTTYCYPTQNIYGMEHYQTAYTMVPPMPMTVEPQYTSPIMTQTPMSPPQMAYSTPISPMENMQVPVQQMSYPVPEFSAGYVPIQESQNLKEEYSPSPTPSIFGSSEEIVNVNDFYNDFLEMQGDYLLSGYNDIFPAPTESSHSPDIKFETFEEQSSGVNMSNIPCGLTMNVDHVRQLDNDRCEGTIQACMKDSKLEGTFSGSFNQ